MPVGVIVVLRGDTEPSALERCQALSTESTHWYLVATQRPEHFASSSFINQRRCTIWLHDQMPLISTARNDAIIQSFRDGCEISVILDQQAVFEPNGFNMLITTMLTEISGLALCHQIDSDVPSLSVFALSSAAYNYVGAFDENIENQSLSAADYFIRARQSGITVSKVKNVLQNSLQDEEFSTSEMQHNYLHAKWGGLPNIKVKQLPFGNMGCRIDWAKRTRPYGVSRDLPRESSAKSPIVIDVGPSLAGCSKDVPESSTLVQRAISVTIVRAVFHSLLSREPDAPALNMYCEQLNRGLITTDTLCEIVRSSDEFMILLKASLMQEFV